MKQEQIQIDKALFFKICAYFLVDEERYVDGIREGLKAKIDALARRELYTKYKMAETDEERNEARLKYLEKIGMKESFRW